MPRNFPIAFADENVGHQNSGYENSRRESKSSDSDRQPAGQTIIRKSRIKVIKSTITTTRQVQKKYRVVDAVLKLACKSARMSDIGNSFSHLSPVKLVFVSQTRSRFAHPFEVPQTLSTLGKQN